MSSSSGSINLGSIRFPRTKKMNIVAHIYPNAALACLVLYVEVTKAIITTVVTVMDGHSLPHYLELAAKPII